MIKPTKALPKMNKSWKLTTILFICATVLPFINDHLEDYGIVITEEELTHFLTLALASSAAGVANGGIKRVVGAKAAQNQQGMNGQQGMGGQPPPQNPPPTQSPQNPQTPQPQYPQTPQPQYPQDPQRYQPEPQVATGTFYNNQNQPQQRPPQ